MDYNLALDHFHYYLCLSSISGMSSIRRFYEINSSSSETYTTVISKNILNCSGFFLHHKGFIGIENLVGENPSYKPKRNEGNYDY